MTVCLGRRRRGGGAPRGPKKRRRARSPMHTYADTGPDGPPTPVLTVQSSARAASISWFHATSAADATLAAVDGTTAGSYAPPGIPGASPSVSTRARFCPAAAAARCTVSCAAGRLGVRKGVLASASVRAAAAATRSGWSRFTTVLRAATVRKERGKRWSACARGVGMRMRARARARTGQGRRWRRRRG